MAKYRVIKPESLETVLKTYYNQWKEVLDVWHELNLANQTEVELLTPEEKAQAEPEATEPVE